MHANKGERYAVLKHPWDDLNARQSYQVFQCREGMGGKEEKGREMMNIHETDADGR